MANGTGNGWLRDWTKPSVLITLIVLLTGGVCAWAALGGTVSSTADDVASLQATADALDDDYVPRSELDLKLQRIDEMLADQKEDLRDIKQALGVR